MAVGWQSAVPHPGLSSSRSPPRCSAVTRPVAEAMPVTRRVTLDCWGDGLLLVLLTMVLGLDWLFRLLRGYE